MFREYALDPGLLTNWRDFRYYVEKFGWHHGRVVCEYPKKWKRMVHQAAAGDTPVNKKRVVEALHRIDDRLIRRRNADYDGDLANDGTVWFRNAVERHKELAFQGIVTESCDDGCAEIILASDIDETHPLMNVGDGIVLRRATAYAEAVSLLLKTARRLLFIDPHFEAGAERFRLPLAEMLKCANISAYRDSGPVLELHIGVGCTDTDDEELIKRRTAEKKRQCEHFLPNIIPAEQQLEVFIWLPHSADERFHNRYILSDSAGVSISTGLDEETAGNTTDDWSRLTNEQHKKRLKQFQQDTSLFRLADHFCVPGRMA